MIDKGTTDAAKGVDEGSKATSAGIQDASNATADAVDAKVVTEGAKGVDEGTDASLGQKKPAFFIEPRSFGYSGQHRNYMHPVSGV